MVIIQLKAFMIWIIISTSSLTGFLIDGDEENVEIDGLIFMYKENKINLYLIESKNTQKSSHRKAKEDLNEKLDKLNLKDKLKNVDQEFNPKGVYYQLII